MTDPYVRVPTPKWHPLEDVRPHGPDELLCLDKVMGEWAIIRTLTYDGETWYRAVTPESDSAARVLVGYSQNLTALAKHAYLLFLHRREAGSGPISCTAVRPAAARSTGGVRAANGSVQLTVYLGCGFSCGLR